MGHTLQGLRTTLVRHSGLWLSLAGLLSVIFFVNPVRETAMEDDWAYALTVKNLLETGMYRAHDWISANMLFQAYWGKLFSYFLGYSHSSLRISTLALAFIGLIGFYCLAKEHGFENLTAGLLTMVMLSSPLFVLFSFNFMTDIPFLTGLILALLFYTRALKLRSYMWLISASLVASATILTRQFGMALAAGFFFSWLLDTRGRKDVLFVFAGLALPITASIWQLYTGTHHSNWAAKYSLLEQWQYFASLKAPAFHLLWRPGVILQYLSLFTLPLVLLSLVALPHEFRAGRTLFTASMGVPENKVKNLELRFLVELAVYVLLGMLWVRKIMPVLPWNMGELYDLGFAVRCILTLITATGAVLYARIFLMRFLNEESWSTVSASDRSVDFVTLFLLLIYLIYFQIGDEYLISLLPFTLIVVGSHLQEWILRYRSLVLVACLFMLAFSAMCTRASLERAEAYWRGGQYLRNMGAAASDIYGSWTWNCYNGDFDRYLADINQRPMDNLRDFSLRWQQERKSSANYLVTSYGERPGMVSSLEDRPFAEKWEIVTKIPYKSIFFREKNAFVVKRVPR